MTLKTNFGCPAGGTASECRPQSYRPHGSHGPRSWGGLGGQRRRHRSGRTCRPRASVLGNAVSSPPAAPCTGGTFFCHSSMCINNSLVCNGVQNCAYPWDENHCRGESPRRRPGRHGPTTAFLLPALQQLRGRHGDASPERSLPWIPDLWMWPRQRKIGLRLGFF